MESVRRAFAEEGFRIIDSSEDEAILEKLALLPSNLVFVVDDSVKGSQICALIRYFSNIPIVAVCSKGTPSQVKMLDLGADACMNWPVSPIEFIARVRSLQKRYAQLYPPNDENSQEEPGTGEG